MTHAEQFARSMLAAVGASPDLAAKHPEVRARLAAWVPPGGGEVLGVIVRPDLRVEKTDTERLVVFYNDKGCLGWMLGKEAKPFEEWERQFPGENEKVWVVPPMHPVLKPLSSIGPILVYMAAWAKAHPAPPVENAVSPGAAADAAPAAQLALAAAEIAEKEASKAPHVKLHNIGKKDIVKKPKAPKAPKPKPDRSLRTVFKAHLLEIDIEKLKKPWMARTDIRLIDTPEALQAWVDAVLADRSRWRLDPEGNLVPVVAADCETVGLDNRIVVDILNDGRLVYEVKAEIAGLCLASHGGEGIYVPIHHEQGRCISREDVARILQPLFDVAHLVFYNAKFDREILKICLGMALRPFPHFEDVQVLQYDNDPKADMDDQKKGKTFLSDAGGLKALSEHLLGMGQIHLEELIKVNARCRDSGTGKETMRVTYAPFNWVPTHIALWYAAADATCTWLLWERTILPARSRHLIHKIDHRLVDSIAWIERQRFLIDPERHAQTVKWHQGKLRVIEARLRDIAENDGWPVKRDDEGNLVGDTLFNVNSNPQIGRLLYDIRQMRQVKKTEGGRPSVDADALDSLAKLYPGDPFLTEYANYKEYVALHPENLRYDPVDHTARVYFRQNVVAGGRLAAQGGEFDVDGGFGLNPQGIKKPSDNWFVTGRILRPDSVPEDQVEPHEPHELHKSCRRGDKIAPDIVKNHIGNYLGYAICLVPSCTTCAEKFGVLVEDGRLDANEVLNLRCLFVAPPGWTFFAVDYSNIEMREAANCSREPKFVKEFLEGEGDFHALTASNVFPEFNDPGTSKERKKYLRGLAKILNFALLYGGTEYTIFENLKKEDPNATIEQAREMVKKYWEGVPVFFQYCERKKQEAREGPAPSHEPKWSAEAVYHHGDRVQWDPDGRYDGTGRHHRVYACLHKGLEGIKGGGAPHESPNWIKAMQCTTAMGRVINFVSAMEGMGIRKPLPAEEENYKQYRRYKDNEEEADMAGDKEKAGKWAAAAQEFWANEDTGVKNFIDWKRFISKVQRVAVNTPLQGLAGDFMRISLNKICQFATEREPLVQAVFRLSATIHDEVDFIVKNEYVPYVLPRITRLMKLRRLHALQGWPVPAECSIEYGGSWDVAHHVTGDKDHAPMAWTKIKGLERYVPDGMAESVKPLLASVTSGDEARRASALRWCRGNLHARAQNAVDLVFKAEGREAALGALVVALQLHEYWGADHVPDDDEAAMEGFLAWEARSGLGPGDRDPKCPPFGFLGAVPRDALVVRPILEALEAPLGGEIPLPAPMPPPGPGAAPGPPNARPTPLQGVMFPVPALRELRPAEKARLSEALGEGMGEHDVSVCYLKGGTPTFGTIRRCARTEVPGDFLFAAQSQ